MVPCFSPDSFIIPQNSLCSLTPSNGSQTLYSPPLPNHSVPVTKRDRYPEQTSPAPRNLSPPNMQEFQAFSDWASQGICLNGPGALFIIFMCCCVKAFPFANDFCWSSAWPAVASCLSETCLRHADQREGARHALLLFSCQHSIPSKKRTRGCRKETFLVVVKILSCTHNACDSTFITALQSLNYVFMVPVWDLKALLTRLFH